MTVLMLKHSLCCERHDLCPKGVSRIPGESKSIPVSAFGDLYNSLSLVIWKCHTLSTGRAGEVVGLGQLLGGRHLPLEQSSSPSSLVPAVLTPL
jgi:hypothetical protein